MKSEHLGYSTPITTYNYSAIRDRLLKKGIKVSVLTIILRAKALGCYKGQPKKKIHDREVLTSAIGDLIQNDACHCQRPCNNNPLGSLKIYILPRSCSLVSL